MARRKKQSVPLPTIWRVDDALWAKVAQVLEEHDPPAHFGPNRIDQRKALDGVIYRMRSHVRSRTHRRIRPPSRSRLLDGRTGGSLQDFEPLTCSARCTRLHQAFRWH